MAATNHTEHYDLSQYTEVDRPTYTGDYNSDMSKIDAAIYAASQSGGGMTTVAHDTTLTGDGTGGNPLGMIDGNFINPILKSGDEADANHLTESRIYKIDRKWKNLPENNVKIISGSLLDASYGNSHIQCILAYTDETGASIFIRQSWLGIKWTPWQRIIKESDLSSYVPLSTYNALAARVTALEQALTQSAPSATGLNAKQLDSQYCDEYNIVRVGTPTTQNETEESS